MDQGANLASLLFLFPADVAEVIGTAIALQLLFGLPVSAFLPAFEIRGSGLALELEVVLIQACAAAQISCLSSERLSSQPQVLPHWLFYQQLFDALQSLGAQTVLRHEFLQTSEYTAPIPFLQSRSGPVRTDQSICSQWAAMHISQSEILDLQTATGDTCFAPCRVY